MLGSIKPEDADRSRRDRQHMSRIYDDLGRSSHHSSPSPDRRRVRMNQFMRPKGKIPNIAIVGAGISGLRCADVLVKSGARVTIYEARDRIGGRVHQAMSDGHLMDMGANWIHGTENNPMANIARRTGTITYNPEERQAIIDTEGNRLDDDLASEISETVWATIVKAFKYSDETSTDIDKSKSLMDYFREEIPKIEKDPKKQSLILEEANMWGAFVGDSIGRQSLKFFFLEECIDGENAFVAGTYKDMLAYIAATALTSADIHYNKEVVFFDTQYNRQDGSPPQTTIHTRSGIQRTYDEVVITTPLGWLKRHSRDAFPSESPLPSRLLQAIDSTCYGRLEKVYITFSTAFWQEEGDNSTCSSPCSLSSSSSTSCSSSRQSTHSYPTFTHFYTPNYTPHPPKQPWNQNLIDLSTLPGSTSKPTLLFYLYGEIGAHLLNLLSPFPASTDPQSPYHKTLTNFFCPYISHLPNYDPHNPLCTPISFLATSWQNDPFAGYGSYTNFQIGVEEGDKDVEVMRDGAGVGEERGIWFAGEHTAPFIALGTTTGAYWSGEGVARRIVSLYDGLVCPEEDDDDKKERDVEMKKVPNLEKRDAANMNGIAL